MRGALPAAILVLALWPRPGRADPAARERALDLYEQGALSAALAAFEDSLRTGENDRQALAEIYLHLGVLRAGARDPQGAETAFAALLALDPQAAPPAGSSPLVTQPFARARGRASSEPLRLVVQLPDAAPAGSALTATARVTGDLAGIAGAARLFVLDGPAAGSVVVARGTPPWSLRFPAEATRGAGSLHYRVELLDAHGSLLDRAGEPEAPRRVQVEARARPTAASRPTARTVRREVLLPPPRADRDRSILVSPWFWGGAALVVAAGVVTVALVASSGSDDAHFGQVEGPLP